jgi:hypothetical protein
MVEVNSGRAVPCQCSLPDSSRPLGLQQVEYSQNGGSRRSHVAQLQRPDRKPTLDCTEVRNSTFVGNNDLTVEDRPAGQMRGRFRELREPPGYIFAAAAGQAHCALTGVV